MTIRIAVCRLLFAIAILASGECASSDFKRPDAGAIQAGKSTMADVINLMGQPKSMVEGLRNNERVTIATYDSIQPLAAPKYPGVLPTKQMTFAAFGGLVVSQGYVSSFAEDATDFDDEKAQNIVKGRSTRDDVIAALGKPGGEAIYPIIKNRGQTAVVYAYTQYRSAKVNKGPFRKILVISFDPAGVVIEVEFVSSGEK